MRLWINKIEIELKVSSPLAINKQLNNIVTGLGTRQSTFTNTVSAPKTASNVRAFNYLGTVGNRSRAPYEKAEAMYQDEDTGDWIIYKGWANAVETTTDYRIFIYEGIIDFFKLIENKSLTDIGISDLNHIKNITTVVDSWDNLLPYMYLVADYNGKNLTSPAGAYIGGDLNIDYLVPSFRMSYAWERIFAFAGKTFSGNVFNTEKFLNWWVTYPKPVPVDTPIVTNVTEQDSSVFSNPVQYPTEFGGLFYGYSYTLQLLPTAFDTAQANNLAGFVLIEQTGAYRLQCSGELHVGATYNSNIVYTLKDPTGLVKQTGIINAANDEQAIINAAAGDKLYTSGQLFGSSSPSGFNPLEGTVHSILDLIVGYDANFDEALIEFSAKKIIDEVMQRFSLTMFPDKYSDNIAFLTLDEIIQEPVIEDWSDKYLGRLSEKYKISNYAQKNRYQYRYNDENAEYNDGFINIDNKNLEDEITVMSSVFYSPERYTTNFFGLDFNVYKIWDREPDQDGVTKYKELSGRFYSMRAELKEFGAPITIKSEALNTSADVTSIQRESFHRLKLQEVIYDNYGAIGNILNDAKLCDLLFNLNSINVDKFDFKRMIFVRQLNSYFLVNKIVNYLKNKPTKVEVLKVDYYTGSTEEEIILAPGTYINLLTATIDGCDLVLTFDTDADLPVPVRVVGTRDTFGGVPGINDVYDNTLSTSGPITITLPNAGLWTMMLMLNGSVYSLPVTINNTAECVVPPPPADGTYITITSIETISVTGNNRNIKINFDTDFAVPSAFNVIRTIPIFGSQTTWFPLTDSPIYMTVANRGLSGELLVWAIYMTRDAVTSNTVNS